MMRTSLFSGLVCLLVISISANQASAYDEERARERDQYELMKLFVETFQQIESNYVKEVDQRVLMEAAIRGMLTELDQYSSFIPPRSVRQFAQMVEQEFGGIGVTVNVRNRQIVVVSPLPGTPAHKAGIRAGDVIVAVEGLPTKGMRLSDTIQKLQGPVGRPVSITIVHAGETDPIDKTLVRELIKAPTVRGERYADDDSWDYVLKAEPKIGYVRMTHFSRFTVREIKAAVDSLVEQKIDGLVLDLRFNPGGLLEAAIQIADLFLDKGEIVSVKGRAVESRSWSAQKGGTYPNFPMAVLVNAYSASASEVLSACLQDNKRAIVVGERTWGKGSVQNIVRLEDGDSALKLTTASYHRPSGVNIHRFPKMKASEEWGVTPDEGYLIPFTAAEWRDWDADRSKRDILDSKAESDPEFEDRQLMAAVSYIEDMLSPGSGTAEEGATTDSPSPKPSAEENAEEAGSE